MTVGLFLFVVQASLPPATVDLGLSEIDSPNPSVDQQFSGEREWLKLPMAIFPEGSATRTIAGDWNDDKRLDAVVLIDQQLFVVVAPGESRGGIRLTTLGSIADFDLAPGAGPLGQDALITVGSAGLTRIYFDKYIGTFVEDLVEGNDWLFASSVRLLARPQLGPPIYIGVAANPTQVIGYLPASSHSTPILTHSAPIERLEVLNWAGDGEEEFVVMTQSEASVYDVRDNLYAQLTASDESSVAIAVVRRALEPHARVAWVTRDSQGGTMSLQLFANGIVEPIVDLGALLVADMVANEMDGDGSDELFLSHQTSKHQVILRSQAEVGDPMSASFDAEEFVIMTALPALHASRISYPTGKPIGGSGAAGNGATGGLLIGTGSLPTLVGGCSTGSHGGGSGGASIPKEDFGRGLSISNLAPGFSKFNTFSRNRAAPAFGDFDNDGDTDLLFPISDDGDLVFLRNDLIDHRDQWMRFETSSLNSAGPDAVRLDFSMSQPDVIAPAATHVELAVWHSDSYGGFTDNDVVTYKAYTIGEWPLSASFVMNEARLPFQDLYHMQLRLVELEPGPEIDVLSAYPVVTASYSSSKSVFEALLAASSIRGGGVTTPKTGPVFVGGIAPRPNLDPFAPGAMPLAPGGGQVL